MQPAARNVLICIGIGSNLGNAAENCRRAVAEIGAEKNINSVRMSPLYGTEPVGEKDQPWFVNGAASFETSMGPRDLLKLIGSIESRMGRVREKKWGPLVIDLDILLYGAEVVNEEGLVIPHPRMHERR
ncbi:MAG TPA: 2-amino-4-hydroxy-6-hydroxymethyldihydropteridine diphosphokinase, partial [Thermodesulfobacteriota bacterium]|nr:2-amino-4-hydroxy-6-hydroxymethyldihydropteridine diphosphokinase [Thermodesulfobacteriota bacterium]